MFVTKFQHASSTALPPSVNLESALTILHDFPVVIRLSPDCRGCKPIEAPDAKQAKKEQAKTNGTSTPKTPVNDASGGGGGDFGEKAAIQHFEVEDDLPFIPKRLWSGGVRYLADFQPTPDGCDITVHAPGGFTSTNHWRLVREALPEEGSLQGPDAAATVLASVGSKDLSHAEFSGGGWHVQIVSDAQCNRTFVGFVKGFLKNSHQQLQANFIELLKTAPPQQRSRRPTMGRRRSSVF